MAKKKTATKKKATKRTTKKSSVNKSQAIRDYRKSHPDAGPTAISKALAKKGIKVTAGQVSTTLSNAGRKTKKKVASKRKVSTSSPIEGSMNLKNLIATQRYVLDVGGFKEANELLGALEELKKHDIPF